MEDDRITKKNYKNRVSGKKKIRRAKKTCNNIRHRREVGIHWNEVAGISQGRELWKEQIRKPYRE